MRNIQFKIAFCFMALSEICFAIEESFFMSPEESAEVLNALHNKGSQKETSKKDFKISGIFYMDEFNWTVWINNVAYSSIGQQKEFSIDEVSESGVSITLDDGSTILLSVSSNDARLEKS